MKPGRELDALIAEKVMGYKKGLLTVPPHNVTKEFYGTKPGVAPYVGMALRDPPCFSTDIAAAWEVVEKIASLKLNVVGDFCIEYCKEWHAGFRYDTYDGSEWDIDASAATAPHAICLAALKAMEK